MICYNCGHRANIFPLMPLWPKQKRDYPEAGIVLRQCPDCGLSQNRVGDDELVAPVQAAVAALTMTHLGPI
jgi:hypothetical protein